MPQVCRELGLLSNEGNEAISQRPQATLIDQIAQPNRLEPPLALSAQLARSHALTTQQRDARLAQIHNDIVAHLLAHIVAAQTELVEPGLGQIRTLLQEYRESAAAAGPQALDRI
jgi:hypothetical protein